MTWVYELQMPINGLAKSSPFRPVARKTFHKGVKRVQEVLKMMEEKPLNLTPYKKRIEERSGKIPKGQKWFLLKTRRGLGAVNPPDGEFLQSAWMSFAELIDQSVQFRVPIYEALNGAFFTAKESA